MWNVGTRPYRKVVDGHPGGITPWFEGIIVNQDTIAGRFRWGAQGAGYEAKPEYDCPATFAR